MVQGIEKVLDKPVYSAVNIRINKPEVNPRENGNMTVTNDNGIYNAVKIDIDRPAINAESKKVYDYPESKEVVTYNNANIQPVALPEGFPAGNAYKANAEDVVAEEVPAEEATVPEANYTTVEQEKAEEPSKEGDVAFHGADNAKKKPEIVPSEEIKPEVNISETVALLSGNDYDKQAVEIAKIAYLSETNPEAAKSYIVRDVFNGLIDVVKKDSSKLQGPSEKQNEIRQKIVADIIAAQRKQPIPYQISKEEQELATKLAPMEMAERNKEYALIAISSLAKNYINQIQKETGNVVPFTDIPGVSDMVDTLRYSKNPDLRIAAVESLVNIYKPEYKDEMTAILQLAQKDKHPIVARIATASIQRLS